MENRVKKGRDWDVFLCSIFFVLGFSLIFSLVGVLLQSALANISYTLQIWLSRIGGAIIILFGLFLLGFITPKFLQADHKIQVKRKFKSKYITSFVFGAAFAVGWTPCVGFILGAILTLAITQPGAAFFLLLSYSLGLGIPFMLVGLFTNEAQALISKTGRWVKYFDYTFGIILIGLGILVFTDQLSRVASLEFASALLTNIGAEEVGLGQAPTIGLSFLAGLASFVSPCILPIIPGFLSYLATTSSKKE